MKLPNLPENKQLRIALIASAAVLVLVIIILLSAGDEKPEAELPGQAALPIEKAVPPAPPNADNSKIILELFNPTQQSLDSQRAATNSNQQIEQTLTVSYVLTKCLIFSQDDYTDTYRALVLYAQLAKLAPDPTSADAKVREIAQSANASYALIYSRTSCTDAQLPTLAKELSQWTTTVFKQQ
jgi:hypothetical protein